jgi:hypothetical protein
LTALKHIEVVLWNELIRELATGKSVELPMKTCARVCFFCLFSLSAYAQDSARDAAAAQQVVASLKAAGTAGTPLDTTSNVSDSLNIEAVMLPSDVVQRVFGKEVSENYAVIEVNIANRNPASAFILHSLYIDYGDWALAQGYDLATAAQDAPTYTARTKSTQVSSVEYRIIRGEVMDRQPFTIRNVILNTMKGVGTAATAFAFPFSGDVSRGISAWNGGVVPAVDTYWPDSTQGQLNRISDYGFRNNKVIPQESADIVVAFFPISRFLPKALKHVFLKNPAAFFSPLMLAIDPNQEKSVEEILESGLGNQSDVKAARKSLLAALAKTDASDFTVLTWEITALQKSIAKDRIKLLLIGDSPTADEKAQAKTLGDSMSFKGEKLQTLNKELSTKFDLEGKGAELFRLLNALSLSKVSVVVSGTMNADEQNIPASVVESCFDNPAPELWAEEGSKTCTLRGRFLLNGVPKIVSSTPSDLGISDIAVKSDASSSDLLTFSYKLRDAMDPPKFEFVVSKVGKNGTSADSMKYSVGSRSTLLPAPTVDSASTNGTGAATKYIVLGTNFFSVKPNNVMTVNLKLSGGSSSVPVANATRDSRTQITLSANDLQALAPGCYAVEVKVGTVSATKSSVNVKVGEPATGSAIKPISSVEKCN